MFLCMHILGKNDEKLMNYEYVSIFKFPQC